MNTDVLGASIVHIEEGRSCELRFLIFDKLKHRPTPRSLRIMHMVCEI